jgi:hypothetical protein
MTRSRTGVVTCPHLPPCEPYTCPEWIGGAQMVVSADTPPRPDAPPPPPPLVARCAVTELEVTGCAHCRPVIDTPRPARALGRWFPARYAGRCSDCDTRFHEDEEIRADGEGGYLCEDCGEELP